MSPPSRDANHPGTQVLMLRNDDAHEKDMLDKLEKVMGNALMAQTLLINYYEDKVKTFRTPHLKHQLEQFHQKAIEHRDKLHEMFNVIERDPSKMKQAMGAMMTKAMEGMANLRGLGVDPYPDLQQLMMVELMSTGAFGLVGQTSVAVGNAEVHDMAMPIAKEKFHHWRYLQEQSIALGPYAIIEEQPI